MMLKILNIIFYILNHINVMEKLKFMRKIMADYSSLESWKS